MSDQEISKIQHQAQALFDAGRYAEAATTLGHGLAVEPRNHELLCMMSHVMIWAQREADAAHYAEQAIAVEPQDAWGHRLRSFALRIRHRREALKSAQQAVQIDPQEPANWHALAAAQLESNAKAAREAAEQMRALAPQSFVPHQLLALAALKQKKYAEAEMHCRRELELNPNSYKGMNNLGVALLNRGRHKEAVETLNLAAKMNPSADLARRNLRIAANKYLSGFGILAILGFALSRLGATSSSAQAQWVSLMVIALSAGFLLMFFLLRRSRFRQLPTETQDYLKYLQRLARFGRLRDSLQLSAILCGSFFFLFSFVAYVNWDDSGGQWHAVALVISTISLAATIASVFGLKRVPKAR